MNAADHAVNPRVLKLPPGDRMNVTEVVLLLREGKNRQIRRLCKRSEFWLLHLTRNRFGPLKAKCESGQCRWLSETEIEALHMAAAVQDPNYERPSLRKQHRMRIKCLWLRAFRKLRKQGFIGRRAKKSRQTAVSSISYM